MPKTSKSKTMDQLLTSTKNALKTFKYGELVEGRVISTSRTQAFVDLGGKSEGVIGGRTQTRDPEDVSALKTGDLVLAKVIQSENDQGYIVLSLKKAQSERFWREVLQAKDSAQTLSVTVTDSNKGGLVVDYHGLSGFIPFSHLQTASDPRPASSSPDSPSDSKQAGANELAGGRDSKPSSLLGQTFSVKVIETDRALNRIVFSQRLAAFSTDDDLKKFLKELTLKKKVPGKVIQLLPFGAVIRVSGGLEGFLHVSEISWSRVDHPEQRLKVGEKINVSVLGLSDQGRLSLSMKVLEKNPWKAIEKKYRVGQKIEGTITKIVPFGAFLQLPEGIEGLIHVSETIGPLEVGEQVKAIIINLEAEKQKLGLSIKQLKVQN